MDFSLVSLSRFADSFLERPLSSLSFCHLFRDVAVATSRPDAKPDASWRLLRMNQVHEMSPLKTIHLLRCIVKCCGDAGNRTRVQDGVSLKSTRGSLLHLIREGRIRNKRKLSLLYPLSFECSRGKTIQESLVMTPLSLLETDLK